jgi:hypothetical protein
MQLRAIDIAVRLSLILCLGFSLEACSSKTDSKKKKSPTNRPTARAALATSRPR